MASEHFSRRNFLEQSVGLGLPVFLAANSATFPSQAAEPGRPVNLRIICVGAHPDDPESGCAGALARYAESGHAVTVMYLTRGERGINGKSLDEAARIRSAECANACGLLGITPSFFGQVDGATEVTKPQVEAMTRLLAAEKPDVVFAHWPIDTHMDHQVASILTIRACMALPRHPQLYFFEVNTGSQSQGFFPNTYIDISPVLEKKRSALFAHVSQDGQGIWRQHHEPIATWRGREAGVAAAEAFVHISRDIKSSQLPGF